MSKICPAHLGATSGAFRHCGTCLSANELLNRGQYQKPRTKYNRHGKTAFAMASLSHWQGIKATEETQQQVRRFASHSNHIIMSGKNRPIYNGGSKPPYVILSHGTSNFPDPRMCDRLRLEKQVFEMAHDSLKYEIGGLE